uniref:cerebellar degeneration-related protein 2 n=1 Tax=Myxine glutinosa TaxID=7769 RepID=UPI00358EE75E
MVSWAEPRDLERDLHLAAELGKSLLEKNQELEEAFHQQYQTNQDQAQKIQFLNQQLEASREGRNHQVYLYEQLQTTTQELEAANHSLRKERHSAQLRVASLQKLVDSLQTEVDELQRRIDRSRCPSTIKNEDKCNRQGT